MTGTFLRLLKATSQVALIAFTLLPMHASAVLMNDSITFEFDFQTQPICITLPCDPIDQGGGTITFPEYGP
jgi:hypothetical protein